MRSPAGIAASARRLTTSPPMSIWVKRRKEFRCGFFGRWREPILRILIGSVLPHLQAGFGGGYKLIFPGTSHRTTLGGLHRQGFDGRIRSGRSAGEHAAGNPMRQAIHAAAELTRPMLVDQPLDAGRRAGFSRGCGDPERVQDLLADEADAPAPGARSSACGSRRRGQSSLAGRPDAELQGVASSSRGVPSRAACWSACSGPIRTRSTARFRSSRCGESRLTGGWGGGPFAGSCRSPSGIARAAGSPAAFMMRWACELVVDRTVLVYAPPLYDADRTPSGPGSAFRRSGRRSGKQRRRRLRAGRAGNAAGTVALRVFPRAG